MSHALVRRVVLAAVAVVALAGCETSGSFSPRRFESREYVLHRVGEKTLPYYQYAIPGGDTLQVLNETIWLGPGGRGTRSATVRYVRAGEEARLVSEVAQVTYAIRGTEIWVQPLCGRDTLMDCAMPDLGTVTDAELRLALNGSPTAPLRVYSRELVE